MFRVERVTMDGVELVHIQNERFTTCHECRRPLHFGDYVKWSYTGHDGTSLRHVHCKEDVQDD
jgi:hypothetical protein